VSTQIFAGVIFVHLLSIESSLKRYGVPMIERKEICVPVFIRSTLTYRKKLNIVDINWNTDDLFYLVVILDLKSSF